MTETQTVIELVHNYPCLYDIKNLHTFQQCVCVAAVCTHVIINSFRLYTLWL